jgi:inorganic pyrophosphatase
MKGNLIKLKTFDSDTKDLNVVGETPKGSRNKFDYDEDLGVFRLGYVLPEGATFSNEFGFIPSTLGEDGDPIDVMVLLDQPTAVGCLLTARLIGVIEAQQTAEDGSKCRNDRLDCRRNSCPCSWRGQVARGIETRYRQRDRAFFHFIQ